MSGAAPVGVFDAGLGAYAVVRAIRRLEPSADVVYLADRASFPYGRKTPAELSRVVRAGARELQRRGCGRVVVASNAPSVTVLPEVAAQVDVPVVGVFPPVRAAVDAVAGDVVVLGAASMVDSDGLAAFLAREAGDHLGRVHARAAGHLIALVESAAFLDEPRRTERAVGDYVASLRRQWPRVEAVTLSSTHLHWLGRPLALAAPDLRLLDPVDDVARRALVGVSTGGSLTCLVTERPGLSAADFTTALGRLTDGADGDPITPQVVDPLG